MSLFQALILGIVEGVTEFLPISSTGHMILASAVLKISSGEFVKSFEIFIQLGAIAAVAVLYFRKFFVSFEYIKKLLTAFLPTAVLGLIFYKIIKTYLLGSQTIVLWALLLGGIFLIIFEWIYKEKADAVEDPAGITYGQAFAIGLFQSVAMIPGVSRAAATIIGGLILGMKRKAIVEFSFMLAVPTMAAAAGLDLIKSAGSLHMSDFGLLAAGFISAFVVAIISIKFLLSFIKNHTFVWFGVYRILVAVIFYLVFIR
jgi:undecaprenyl-diphosphatase